MKAIADRLGVPYVDLLPEFVGVARTGVRPFLDSNTHPNDVGHNIAAVEMVKFLTSRGLLMTPTGVASRDKSETKGGR